MVLNIAIMGSTRGRSVYPAVEYIINNPDKYNLACVVSNKSDSPIATKALEWDCNLFAKEVGAMKREFYDAQMTKFMQSNDVDIILMVGYMRIVSDNFISDWRGKMFNVHPSLLPKHGGLMDLDVHRAVISNGDKKTGCTIHHVTEEVDAGEVVSQIDVNVDKNDDEHSLKQKVQELEAQSWLRFLENYNDK